MNLFRLQLDLNSYIITTIRHPRLKLGEEINDN